MEEFIKSDNEKLFGEPLTNFKLSKQSRKYISKINKKHK